MRVFVRAIEDGDPRRVQLDSEVGSFWAEWRGEPAPALGETFVEVDSYEDLVWGADIVSDPDAGHRIETVGDETWISGTVDGVPLDGPVMFTVGPTVVWLDGEGDPPPGIVGTTATARTKALFVVPENY
jgi:hypothetical protein